MAVDKETVKYIAKLSKLKLSEEEEQKFTLELNTILGYMEKLNSIDTSDVEPLSYPIDGMNVFREDEIKKSVERDEVLKNAPSKTDEYFKVPKIL